MNPAGNTTLFILEPIPHKFHGVIAQNLMKPEYLSADQVGFIEKPRSGRAVARLQMMGDEFCGNAARALAVLLTKRGYDKIHPGGTPNNRAQPWTRVPLEVSGYRGILEASVSRVKAGYWAEIAMPAPGRVREMGLTLNKKRETAIIVELPGITHVVLNSLPPSRTIFQDVIRQIDPGAALGLMFYEPGKKLMTPLVAVRKSGTLVWEGSCASGTVALAAAQAYKTGRDIKGLNVRQPGGVITVDLEYSAGKPGAARIRGPVEFVAEGTVCLPAQGGDQEKFAALKENSD